MFVLHRQYHLTIALTLFLLGSGAALHGTEAAETGAIERRPSVMSITSRLAARRPPPMAEITITGKADTDRSKSSTGTAFALDSAGNWLTARHVVDNCSRIFMAIPPSHGARTRYHIRAEKGPEIPVVATNLVALDHKADLALLRTRETRQESLTLAKPGEYETLNGQMGFGIGFPGGKPGEVAAQLMGHAVSILRMGEDTMRQPSLVWNIKRQNTMYNILNGISGGPFVNPYGEIIGVNSAGNSRRGRIITVAPVALDKLLANYASGLTRRIYRAEPPLDEKNYNAAANRLRDRFTVAQVICFR